MTFTSLQWMGPELARAGLLFNEDWAEPNVSRAVALYPNQGMHTAATLLAALHPHAIDYLEQAPVLALAATFGAKLSGKRERAYVAMNFGPLMERGRKLRDVMAAFRVAYQLRQVSGNAIRPGVWGVIQAITRLVDPSTISQSIPAAPTRHMHWLGDLAVLWTALQRRAPDEQTNAAILRWAMFALSRHGRTGDPGEGQGADALADFLICNRDQWNDRWTWDRLVRETQDWHEALAEAQIDRINDGSYDTDVAYGAFPSEVTLGGFDFHALRSLRALVVEGKAMHHCVASYYSDIQSGRARIYSIRKDGRRLATVEFMPLPGRVRAVQVKGVCNARPAKEVIAVADKFASVMTDPDKALRGVHAATREAFRAARLGATA